MEEEIKKTPDEILLEDILNELDITFEDKKIKKKINDHMEQGRELLEKLKGGSIDFKKEKTARRLLFSFCRYGRSNATEQFEHDFAMQLTQFSLQSAIEGMKEGGGADESEV